jgi:hypothetical protein
MIVVRDVFQAKYGKGGELVNLLKEAQSIMPQTYPERILTDASGQFFTIVTEAAVADLVEWERVQKTVFSHPDFGKWFAQMQPLVESGRREFYNVEATR